MKQWYMIIDVEKCENCRNCFLACKDEHVGNDWPEYASPMPDQGQSWIAMEGKERGRYPFVDVAYLPTPCMHCNDAPCVKAAKDAAVYRRPDGIVLIDPVKAKGQKALADACPYRAITWNEALQLPQKCTFCAHLLDKGWTQTRCAQSCPTGALTVRAMEEDDMRGLAEREGLETYRPGLKTAPRVYYRNLSRFTKCFIGGSIAIRIDGREECAEGVRAILVDPDGKEISECLTDNYGDFKFDGLEASSGRYGVRLTFAGCETKTIAADLKESAYIGVIFLSPPLPTLDEEGKS
jgi:Fe-S-cluster-containing dehydrogenase component